jgi:peroxidase
MNYDDGILAQIYNEFAVAAFRFGHTMVNENISKADRNLKVMHSLNFRQLMLLNEEAYSNGGLDAICLGALRQSGSRFDAHLSDSIQNHLFESDVLGGKQSTRHHSLSALNIQRGRDHGIKSYVSYRRFCALSQINSFDDLLALMDANTVFELKRVYENVNDIDLFTGLVSEIPKGKAAVGPTTACILN